MSLDLYRDQLQQDANTRPGTATVEPGIFDNFFRGTGMLAMREVAKVQRTASMALSVFPIIADKIIGGTELQSKYFASHDNIFRGAVDYWTPKPGEVGLAAEIAGPLLGILPQVLFSPAGAVANATMAPAEDLINEPGVSAKQAIGVGVAQGAGFALGIWAPAALGYNLPSRVATGAGMNWFQGVVTRGASTAILSGTEAAKNYPAFGGKEQIIDILLGAAFGGAAHVVPGWRAESERVTDQLNVKGRREIKEEMGAVTQFDLGAAAARATNNMRAAGEAERAQRLQDWADSLKPSDKAALAVHRLGQHLNIDSAPGKATGPLATEIHVERMRSTIDAILRGDPLPPEPVPRETMDQFTTRVGQELGEPLGLAPEVALLQRAYIEQGPEAGRAMLDELADQVPDRPDGFVEQAHQQLTERAEQFKNAETPFAPDPQREADAMEITRGMQEAAPRIAHEEGLPEGPTILLPIEDQLKAHLMETGYRQADGTWRKLTQDEASQYIKDHAALYAPTWQHMSYLTEGKMSPEQLAHRFLAGVKMRAPAPAGALEQRLTPAQHIADFKPSVETSQYGGTRYRNQYLDLGNSTAYGKGEKGERRAFRIMDKSAGTAADVGFVILEIDRNGKFAALRNIEIRKDIQGKGLGENVVATLVAHNGRGYTMDVVDITHGGKIGTDEDALPFWKSMGTQLKNYSSDSNVQMDGMLSLEDYLGARSGQRTAAGNRGTAGGNLPADGSPAGAARGSLPGSGPTAADRAELARLNSLFQGEKPRSVVHQLALDEQKAAGWDHDWPFIPADLLNRDFRELIAKDPEVSPDEKARIFAAGNKLGVVPKAEIAKLNSTALFQSTWYHSALSRAIDNVPTKAQPAQGWKDWLKGQIQKGAIKADEVKYTGLEEYLDLQPGKITKEQLQTFMQEGGVRVEEVELGGKTPAQQAWESFQQRMREKYGGRYTVENMSEADDAERVRLADEAVNDAAARSEGAGSPRFANWQLPGAKEGSYRELALVLPTNAFAGREKVFEEYRPRIEALYAKLDKAVGAESARLTNELRALQDERNARADKEGGYVESVPAYRTPSAHSMGAAADTNRLAHIRFNERTGPNGERVLFIEEIQSDWAQEGKKKGFSAPRWTPAEEARFRELEASRPYPGLSDAERAEHASLLEKQALRGVAPGPFVGKTDAWVALSLKRMIRYAAENDFDQIAWTTGEQQAARYDLSKQVDEIVHFQNDDGTWDVQVAKDGNVIHTERAANQAKLADLVGKEAAEKIVKGEGAESGEGKSLSGLDLKVGGEGMKGFYDKIVPSVAKDVLKKLGGGQVEGVTLGGDERARLAIAPIDGGGYTLLNLDANVGSALERTGNFATRAEAEAARKDALAMRQQGFAITPEMRTKAMESQALFQDQARGYLSIGDDRQMTIGFLQSTDPSTPIHEPAHFFLEMLDDLAREHPKAEAEMQVLFKEWGVDRQTWDTWSLNDKRFFHEQFARSWEAYIMTNKAPTPELRSVFRRFRDWLISVYETAQTLNVKVSTEMRALFDRLHGSQQLDPSTDPAATAAASGAPPPPQPGVESQPPGTVDPFTDMAGEPTPYVAKTIEDPGMREFLRAMVEQEVGWAQIGGRNLGMANGVPNFSTWIPKAEWWQARPANVKKLKESEYFDAVNKALLGEPLKPLEQRAVDFMTQVANQRMEAEGAMGKADWLEASKAVHEAGLEPTTANVVDADAVAIANQINEGMVERLAMQYDADDAGFMAEIRRMIDDHQNPETAAGRQEAVGQPQEAIPAARPAAEPSPKAGAETAGSARVDLLAQEADRFVAERPDLMLEFDMPDGTTQKMTAAQYLADVRESADNARDDVKLIYEAAQCLLGAA